MKSSTKLALIVVLIVAVFFRFFRLNEVPIGIHADGASQGYNAFSLLRTGKDMYGKVTPLIFRANGSFQPPIYTYLAIIPIALFGNSFFSVRFISASSGVLAVLLTFAIVRLLAKRDKRITTEHALMAALTVAFTPQLVYFSRLTIEANLSMMMFLAGTYFFLKALDRVFYFPLSMLIFGIGTHTYYSERIIVVAVIFFLIVIFRKVLIRHKAIVLFGLVLFLVTQMPHLYLSRTGAFTKRFDQVSYINQTLVANTDLVTKVSTIGGHFIDHYFLYFSPDNLFFDRGIDLGLTSPDLGAFYGWFVFPAIVGVWYLLSKKESIASKVFLMLLLVAPLPAALTGDDFYPLRAIVFLWVMAVVISFGICEIWNHFNRNKTVTFVLSLLFLASGCLMYISYFGVFKYEASKTYGYQYVKLIDYLPHYRDRQIEVDATSRSWGAGIIIAYLTSFDPVKMQQNLSSQLTGSYYNSENTKNDIFVLDNLVVKPIDWGDFCVGNYLVVGDYVSISLAYARLHGLTQDFVIKDVTGEEMLYGYSTVKGNTCEN